MFKTERWGDGDVLVVYSASRKNNDQEPELLGIASVRKVTLSDGHASIEAKLEIRPYCEPDEIQPVQGMLLAHINKLLDREES